MPVRVELPDAHLPAFGSSELLPPGNPYDLGGDSWFKDMPEYFGRAAAEKAFLLYMSEKARRVSDVWRSFDKTPEPFELPAFLKDDDSRTTTRDPWPVGPVPMPRFDKSNADFGYDARADGEHTGSDLTIGRDGCDDEDEEEGEPQAPFPDIAMDDEDMMYVFKNIICKADYEGDEEGVTIMLRDVPYRYQVEPNLINMVKQLSSIDDVSYIYLPISGPDRGADREPRTQSRNKGYGFIHFTCKEASAQFLKKIDTYEMPENAGKRMFGSLAKFQGVASNIHNVLDVRSKKWRPKHGLAAAYVRTHSGLTCISLMVLRNLAKHYAKWSKSAKCPSKLPSF
jgi:hypothetical protein